MKKCPFCGNEPKHHEGDDYVLSHDPECFFTRHYAQEMWLVGKRHVDQWSARQDEKNPTSDPEAAEVMYQAACSGLWYTNPKAAGSVMAIRVYGKRYPIPVFDEDAELACLREDKAMLDWTEEMADVRIWNSSKGSRIEWSILIDYSEDDPDIAKGETLRDAIRAAMEGSAE